MCVRSPAVAGAACGVLRVGTKSGGFLVCCFVSGLVTVRLCCVWVGERKSELCFVVLRCVVSCCVALRRVVFDFLWCFCVFSLTFTSSFALNCVTLCVSAV